MSDAAHDLHARLAASLSERVALHATLITGTHGSAEDRAAGIYTRRSFLRRILADVRAFNTLPEEERTLAGLIEHVYRATDRLERFETLYGVEVGLDSVHGTTAALGEAVPVNITLALHERPRLRIKTGVGYERVSGQMLGGVGDMTASLANAFGGAERLSFSYWRDLRTLAGMNMTATAPVAANPNRWVEASVFRYNKDWKPAVALDELVNGASVKYRHLWDAWGVTEVFGEAVHRRAHRLNGGVGPRIRMTTGGDSLKTSIGWSHTIDALDDGVLPTHGGMVRVRQEVATPLLGGSVGWVRNEMEARLARRIGNDASLWSLGGSLRVGYLHPFGRDATTPAIPVTDKFFLGGPTSVRGFRQHGQGPHENGYALGGDICVAGGVSLLTPLPYFTTPDLRGHVFVNGGVLGNVMKGEGHTTDGVPAAMGRLLRTPSVSMGIGLAYRFAGSARVEVSLCVPISLRRGEAATRGVQVGVGLEFI